jgi:hypothetical protein
MNQGAYSALVTVGREAEEQILKDGRIRTEWHRWRVREYLMPVRCYNCQHFGHVGSECMAERRNRACLRCAQV